MKIYGGKIFIGVIIFVGFAALPFYGNLGKATKPADPKVDKLAVEQWEQKHGKLETKCVESKDYMKAEHMQLLNDWRDSALRDGNRVYVNSKGERIDISLQNTCLECHPNKKKFCDECHNYMAVKPYCWDCHIAPKDKEEMQ